jgi:hypothetical protein
MVDGGHRGGIDAGSRCHVGHRVAPIEKTDEIWQRVEAGDIDLG